METFKILLTRWRVIVPNLNILKKFETRSFVVPTYHGVPYYL